MTEVNSRIDALTFDLKQVSDRVAALESKSVGQVAAPSTVTGKPPQAPPLADVQLENTWADKTVKYDPKFWKGDSCVDKPYSECPVDYLEMLAGNLEWKVNAEKSKPEAEQKKFSKGKNAGKPMYESDWFEAKIIRTWIARLKANPPIAGLDDEPTGQPGSDGIPW